MIWAFALSASNKGFLKKVADDAPSDKVTNKEIGDLAD